MEVPPGRAERISDGGPEAIRALLKELRAMKFNGLLKTSVYRGDTPSQGVLVLRGGDGVLAEHRSKVDVAGPDAVSEIVKDAASERAQLEVRTYDYGHSAISIDQLQRSYPEATVKGLGEGPRGIRDPTPEPRGARGRPHRPANGTGRPRGHARGARDGLVHAGGIAGTRASATQRAVRKPSRGNAEDQWSPAGLRWAPRGHGTSRERIGQARTGIRRQGGAPSRPGTGPVRPVESDRSTGKERESPTEGLGAPRGRTRVEGSRLRGAARESR